MQHVLAQAELAVERDRGIVAQVGLNEDDVGAARGRDVAELLDQRRGDPFPAVPLLRRDEREDVRRGMARSPSFTTWRDRAAYAEIDPDVIVIDLENPNRDMLEGMFALSGAVKRPIAMFVSTRNQHRPSAA